MKTLNLVTLFLIIVGGLNWGFEAMGFNLVETLFGVDTALNNIVYALVGLSAVWQLMPFSRAIRIGEVPAEAAARR